MMNDVKVLRLTLWAAILSLAIAIAPGYLRRNPALPQNTVDNTISPTEITQPPRQPEAVISFSKEELQYVRLNYRCDYRPDLEALLTAPLNLPGDPAKKTVLILHTHGSESFSGDYEMVESYRTLDDTLNMIAIGDEVARILELSGIRVLHDRNIYDYPDYSGAYSAARKSIKAYLQENPEICLVLDLHRDAGVGDYGSLITSSTVGGQKSAQLMLVAGTDGSGKLHPNWQQNLSLAMKLSVLLEQANPGITRPIELREQRFNMDLSTGSLLVEVGAAGNTLEEAKIAANALALAVLELLS